MTNRNFFLGLGIGIIISSIVFYISFIVVNKTNIKNSTVVEMSDEQIISKAKELGMVLFSGLPATGQSNLSDEDIILKAVELGMVFEKKENSKHDLSEANQMDTAKKIEVVEVRIDAGSSSESVAKTLYELNLIEDMDGFVKYTKDKKKSTKIRAGNFQINKGSTFDEILTLLTAPPNKD